MKQLRLLCLFGATMCSWLAGHAQTVELINDTIATITTTAAGQIGTQSGLSYAYADGVKSQLGKGQAKYFSVEGPINDADVNAILDNGGKNNVLTLDLSGATIDHLEEAGATSDKTESKGTFYVAAKNSNYPLIYLALPKITSTTQTNIPTFVISNYESKIEETGIAQYATVKYLSNLIIPEGYTSIDDGAFAYTMESAATDVSLIIPEGVKKIGNYAFSKCKVANLTLPKSLETIGDQAFLFHKCQLLVFKENLKYLGEEAFLSSSNDLQDVYFLGKDAPECANDVFGNGPYTGWGGHTNFGDQDYATRDNFYNNGHYFCILHYRPDLTDEQLANYWDVTREYHYKDLYLGSERTWPNQADYNKAHGPQKADDSKVGAINGYLFDGSEMTDEQKKHIGILRFVLGRADAPIPDQPLPVKDNSWWTLCLPYTLTKAEIQEYFGDETQVWKFNRVTRDYDNFKINIIFQNELSSDDDYIINAWYPYVIKPSKEFTADDKIIINKDPELGSARTNSFTATKTGSYISDTEYNWIYSFHGSCSGVASDQTGIHYHRPSACYFMGGKVVNGKTEVKFYYQNLEETQTNGNIWNPYTCVLIPYKTSLKTQLEEDADDSFKTSSGNSAKSYITTWGDEETDAIWTVNIVTPDDMVNGNIYNMQGQLVKANADSTDGLPKGMYIHNGKKIVVK